MISSQATPRLALWHIHPPLTATCALHRVTLPRSSGAALSRSRWGASKKESVPSAVAHLGLRAYLTLAGVCVALRAPHHSQRAPAVATNGSRHAGGAPSALCSLSEVEPQWLFWVLWTPHFFCGTLLMSHQMMVFPAIFCAEVSGGRWREPFIPL